METSGQKEQNIQVNISSGLGIGLVITGLLVGFLIGSVSTHRQAPKAEPQPIPWAELDQRYLPNAAGNDIVRAFGNSFIAMSNMNVRVSKIENYLGEADKAFGILSAESKKNAAAIANLGAKPVSKKK